MTMNIDGVLNNADWVKRAWDLPTTLDEFRSPLLSDNQLRAKMYQLVLLPVSRSMPDTLKADLRKEYGQHFVPQYLDHSKNTPQFKVLHVRTPEGSRKFKLPIGAPIVDKPVDSIIDKTVDKIDDYHGSHHAPDKESGSPLNDVSSNGIYPSDIYSPKAVQYYGTGNDVMDRQAYSLIQSFKDKPNASVTIYRAVPNIRSTQDKINELEKQKAYILRTGKLPSTVKTSWSKSEYYDYIHAELEHLKTIPADEHTDAPKIGINAGDWGNNHSGICS